jgi:hypothetical protein
MLWVAEARHTLIAEFHHCLAVLWIVVDSEPEVPLKRGNTFLTLCLGIHTIGIAKPPFFPNSHIAGINAFAWPATVYVMWIADINNLHTSSLCGGLLVACAYRGYCEPPVAYDSIAAPIASTG